MATPIPSTYLKNPEKAQAERKWHVIDVAGLTLKSRPAREMLASRSDEVIRRAVWGMLPKGPLGRVIIKKLKIYSGPTHEHVAQQPRVLDFNA